jgi:hypothetical protein
MISLRYIKLSALHNEAIKELLAKINQLEDRIKLLEQINIITI